MYVQNCIRMQPVLACLKLSMCRHSRLSSKLRKKDYYFFIWIENYSRLFEFVWRRLCLEALFLGYIFVLKELFATIDWRQYPLGLYISLSLLLNFICTFLKKSNSWQQTITNILFYFIWFIFLLYIFFIAIEFYYF